MTSKYLAKIAMRLASWSGDDSRANEVADHLVEAEANGAPVEFLDVVSVATLVARRVVREIPWWIAGLPIPLAMLGLLSLTYENHFFAWDAVGADEHPRTAVSKFWQAAIVGLAASGVIAGLAAGRVAVHQLQQRMLGGPLALLAALFLAASQVDLFIERTPWWRDGRLRPEHVNEIPVYSVALFAAVAVIPVLYLLTTAFLRSKRLDHRTPSAAGQNTEEQALAFDPIALAAAGLPLLVWFAGPFVLLVTLTFIWIARSFSTSLKALATIVLAAPLMAVWAWITFMSSGIDDISPPIILGVLALWLALWLRIAVIALGPAFALHLSRHVGAPDGLQSHNDGTHHA